MPRNRERGWAKVAYIHPKATAEAEAATEDKSRKIRDDCKSVIRGAFDTRTAYLSYQVLVTGPTPEPEPEVCMWATTQGWGEEGSNDWISCNDQADNCNCGLRLCSAENRKMRKNRSTPVRVYPESTRSLPGIPDKPDSPTLTLADSAFATLP